MPYPTALWLKLYFGFNCISGPTVFHEQEYSGSVCVYPLQLRVWPRASVKPLCDPIDRAVVSPHPPPPPSVICFCKCIHEQEYKYNLQIQILGVSPAHLPHRRVSEGPGRPTEDLLTCFQPVRPSLAARPGPSDPKPLELSRTLELSRSK